MVLRFFLFAAIFLLVSCTGFERNNPDDPGSINYAASLLTSSPSGGTVPGTSSSSAGGGTSPSSPSTTPSSSSMAVQTEIIRGESVHYQGETYETVKIGSQIWMARNLNYKAEGSKCYAEGVEGVSADSIAKNCATYGRLYDWATAMAIDARYNGEWWDINDDKADEKHQGICPNGWHIPSDADWDALINAVGGAGTAGKKLKATSGWNDDRGRPSNGEDAVGFAALPGGVGFGYSGFTNAGNNGVWWSALEDNASYVYVRSMNNSEYVDRAGHPKGSYFLSVRCVKD